MDMKTLRKEARRRLVPYCRVCPVCAGEPCSGEVPGMGGLGTGSSFRANLEALAAHRLRMRVIHEVTEPDTAVSLLGEPLSLPVLAAPIGGVSFNMGGPISEREYMEAVLGGCRDAGTMGCGGDGVPPFIHETANQVIAALGGMGIPFIKPWDSDELHQKIQAALDSGARMIGIDLDAAGLVTLRQMGRPVAPKPAGALRALIAEAGVPFLLKGIMTPEDARRAVDVGAGAVVVSNHGGRVLDHLPGAAEALPEVVTAVGDRVTVLADGGVRSGADVLKLLALGADAVLIGRPFAVAAVGGGRTGVAAYLEAIRNELISAMVLTATASASMVDPGILWRAAGSMSASRTRAGGSSGSSSVPRQTPRP